MIRTERLVLVPATLALCAAELGGRDELSAALGARVNASWPPAVFEPDDVARLRSRLESKPETAGWVLYYLLLSAVPGDTRELVGVAGFPDTPNAEGSVEIGYAVVPEHQRLGYATEAVSALLAHAFADPAVSAISATTYAELGPSISVLQRTGFVQHEATTSGKVFFRRGRGGLEAVSPEPE